MTLIQQNLTAIKARIAEYEKKYGREPGSIQLLAVSKGQPLTKIEEAIASGQKAFGESYVQEALPKITALASPSIEWHFIGAIQSNKTRKITEHFSWVHSVRDKKIATRLNDQRPAHLPPLNICIEVNISQEATKSGMTMADVAPLAEYCQTLPCLKLRGLMVIPIPKENFAEQRAEFAKLRHLWITLRQQGITLDTLSMGMSEDFEAAIAEGATIVRIGTAIFEERDRT